MTFTENSIKVQTTTTTKRKYLLRRSSPEDLKNSKPKFKLKKNYFLIKNSVSERHSGPGLTSRR